MFIPNSCRELRLIIKQTTWEFFGSQFMKDMIAPSKVSDFWWNKIGIVTNPLAGNSINIDPELELE